MVNVSSRDVDRFEKRGHEIKIVHGGVEKLFILDDLIPDMLVADGAI